MKLTTSTMTTTTVTVRAMDMIAYCPSSGGTEGAITLANDIKIGNDRIDIEGTPAELIEFAEHLWMIANHVYHMDMLDRGEAPSESRRRVALNPRFDYRANL